MFNFNLVNTRQIVFNRILRRNNFSSRSIQFVKGGVKRSRLSRTRWPRNKNNTVWSSNKLSEAFVVSFAKAQLNQTNANVVFIQNTHDDRLSVRSRNNRNAQVQLFFAKRQLNTTVLSSTTLCNIELRKNFKTRDQSALKTFRQGFAFDQLTVDSIANTNAIFKRLNVNIRRAQLNGFRNNLVAQTHDGSVAF